MGKNVDSLNWSKFPNEPAAEGARWVKLDDVLRAARIDEAALRTRADELADKLHVLVPLMRGTWSEERMQFEIRRERIEYLGLREVLRELGILPPRR